MSTDIARTDHGTLPDRMKYAQALASASLLPKAYQQNPGNVLLAMELGDALNIRPIQAITGIHVIDGKPSASADLIASLIRRAGHRLRVTGNDTSATASLIRADDPEFSFDVTWTIERAKAAGLAGKGVWKSYPAAMLKARAITEVARAGASDALYGCVYTPEELGANVDASGEPVQHPTQQRSQPARGGVQSLRDHVAPAPADDVVDADVVVDADPAEFPTPGAQRLTDSINQDMAAEAALITPAQQKALHAGLGGAGLGDRTSALAFLSDLLDREVDSTKTLSVQDASKAIGELALMVEDPFTKAQPAPADAA